MRWCLVLLIGCAGKDVDPEDDGPVGDMTLSLPDFEAVEGEDCELEMPVAFECNNSNPTVVFDAVPADASSIVLIFDDPDAGDFPHWAMWGIPTDVGQLDAGISGELVSNSPPAGASELMNGFSWEGYLGSCPPARHVYRWTAWAVDDSFEFSPPGGTASAEFTALRTAARDASLQRASACHVYGPRSQ